VKIVAQGSTGTIGVLEPHGLGGQATCVSGHEFSRAVRGLTPLGFSRWPENQGRNALPRRRQHPAPLKASPGRRLAANCRADPELRKRGSVQLAAVLPCSRGNELPIIYMYV